MLKFITHTILFILLLTICLPLLAQEEVAQWERFEINLTHSFKGNAFMEVDLKAKFVHQDTSFVVTGFYDGNDQFKIRFMPPITGTWKYIVRSNLKELDGSKGEFNCVEATGNNHGMVGVSDVSHFKYADGKMYFPFGTTAYAWTHMGEGLQDMTLQTLEESGFNKVRMCVLPKNYSPLVTEEPRYYPFLIKETIKDKEGASVNVWDFERFNPEFFQRLENRIDELAAIGVESDLIIFHPYDKGRWGFDAMSDEVDIRYAKYLVARLSAYKNVWWSLANEWNFMKAKTTEDWKQLIKTVTEADPYGHLCSIHGSTASYFDYWEPALTHVSLQDEGPVKFSTAVATLSRVYKKPIVFDEVGYEGNLSRRWGWLSPEKMMHLVWNGVMGGAYVSHGETYKFHDDNDTIFWADGGQLRGSSWKRIKFLQSIMAEIPEPIFMTDISRDLETSSAGEGYYFIYFGEKMQEEWLFNLPAKNGSLKKLRPNTKFKVDVIDAWDMTITPYPAIFITGQENRYRLYDEKMQEIRLPYKPYIALRIIKVE